MKLFKGFLLFFLFTVFNSGWAKDIELYKFYNQYWDITHRSIEYLHNGEILADAQVETQGKLQEYSMDVAAVHKKSCSKILRKLSMFEQFSEWISFIKLSHYDDKNKLWTLKAQHALLPYPMLVHIIVKRPTKPGKYQFVFPTGIFTGLKGYFIIKKHKNKCVFYATSHWKGKDTGLADLVIELFSETLTKMGGQIVFRKIQ